MSAFMKSVALGAAVVMGLGTMASAATVEVARFQNGLVDPFGNGTDKYYGTEDTWLNGGATTAFDNNYGGTVSFVGNNARGNLALIRFDLTGMQGKYDHVTSISLFLRPKSTPSGITVSVFSVLPANGDWVEGTGGGSVVTDGSSTWNSKRSYGAGDTSNVAWKDADGNDTAGLGLHKDNLTDTSTWGFDPTPLATVASTPVSGSTIRFNLPVSLAEQWISGTNYGLVFTSLDAAAGDVPTYYSAQNGGGNAASPELVINYVVPEPMTGSILLLSGGLLLLRRRRDSEMEE